MNHANEPVRSFEVKTISHAEAKPFIEKWHYSGSINGVRITHAFGLYSGADLIGAMIYGGVGMANAWRKFASCEKDVIELRRLCCIDNTPKNTESYFIGKTLKWLKRNTKVKIVLSYADASQGHSGVIYRASNFQHVGMTSPGRVILWNGKQYHDKTIRTYYVNVAGVKALKPFAARVKAALGSGEATYIKTLGKHTYTYNLRGNQ